MYAVNTLQSSEFAMSEFVDSNFLSTNNGGGFTLNYSGTEPSSGFGLYRGSNYLNQFVILSDAEAFYPVNMKYAYMYNDSTRPFGGPSVALDVNSISNSSYVPVNGLLSASDYETNGLVHLRGTSSSSVSRILIEVFPASGGSGDFFAYFSVPGAINFSTDKVSSVGAGTCYYSICYNNDLRNQPTKVGKVAYSDKTLLSEVMVRVATDAYGPTSAIIIQTQENSPGLYLYESLDSKPNGNYTLTLRGASSGTVLPCSRADFLLTTPFVRQ